MKKAGDEWQIERNLVLKEGKIYMLKNEKLKVEIIWLHHDVLAVEYGGRWKITELVTGSNKGCEAIYRRI